MRARACCSLISNVASLFSVPSSHQRAPVESGTAASSGCAELRRAATHGCRHPCGSIAPFVSYRGRSLPCLGPRRAAPMETLRRAEFAPVASAARLAAELRRDRDRARRRPRPLGSPPSRRAWIAAGTPSSLESTSSAPPRLVVYWHVERYPARGLAGAASQLDVAGVCARVAGARDGRHAAEVLGAVADVDGDLHLGAARRIAERRVFEWFVRCNLHGASPSSTDSCARFPSCFPAGSDGDRRDRLVQGAVSETRGSTYSAGVFRRRWRVEFRQLPKANELTNAELSDGVAPLRGAWHRASRPRAARPFHLFVYSLGRDSCLSCSVLHVRLPRLGFFRARCLLPLPRLVPLVLP